MRKRGFLRLEGDLFGGGTGDCMKVGGHIPCPDHVSGLAVPCLVEKVYPRHTQNMVLDPNEDPKLDHTHQFFFTCSFLISVENPHNRARR